MTKVTPFGRIYLSVDFKSTAIHLGKKLVSNTLECIAVECISVGFNRRKEGIYTLPVISDTTWNYDVIEREQDKFIIGWNWGSEGIILLSSSVKTSFDSSSKGAQFVDLFIDSLSYLKICKTKLYADM
ncbi:MAG: hypothetical protein CVV25_10215 [Ignavibacteriae bacterium HGW-Ignavibacteriae-4]|nr:MAG: hypothetical protein CVV25_10215 [Ignavibacteriae bacterium HGW-Ignavibacteriae-4]